MKGCKEQCDAINQLLADDFGELTHAVAHDSSKCLEVQASIKPAACLTLIGVVMITGAHALVYTAARNPLEAKGAFP